MEIRMVIWGLDRNLANSQRVNISWVSIGFGVDGVWMTRLVLWGLGRGLSIGQGFNTGQGCSSTGMFEKISDISYITSVI